MSLLSPEVTAVLRVATIEVMLRGIGANDEWDYNIRDCLVVSCMLRGEVPVAPPATPRQKALYNTMQKLKEPA